MYLPLRIGWKVGQAACINMFSPNASTVELMESKHFAGKK
jgi:hypothetical protein